MPTKVNSLGTARKRKKTAPVRKGNKKSFLRVILFSLTTIFISSLIVAGIYLYNFINAPFTSANKIGSFTDEKVWFGDEVNLLIIKVSDLNDKSAIVNFLAVSNFNLNQYRYRFYTFPLQEQFDYYDGTGTLADIYDGDKSKEENIEFITRSLRKHLAIRIDGYVLIDDYGYSKVLSSVSPDDINYNDLSSILRVRNTLKLPGMISEFRSHALTNLTFYDLFGFLHFIKSTSETSSFNKSINKYVFLDNDLWDITWKEKLRAEAVKKEYSKVLILNASHDPKIPGLAKWGSRIVENSGAVVLDMQNSYEELEENLIISSIPDSATVKELQKALNISKIWHPDDLKNGDYNPQIFRSDITLVLTDY